MKQTEKEKRQQQYEDYVKKKTPVHNVYLNMAKAFLTGGIICVIGQGIYNYCEMIGLSKDHCSNGTFVLDLDAVLKEEVRLLIRNLTSPFIPRFVSASDGSPVLILLHIILFAALHEAIFFLIVFQ